MIRSKPRAGWLFPPVLQISSRDFYLSEGAFDHEEVLFRKWREYLDHFRRLGCLGVRVLGELPPEIQYATDDRSIVRYEVKLTEVIGSASHLPVCVLCQYDARIFKGDLLMAIQKAHPLVMVKGKVYFNPMFQPEADL